MGACVGSRLQPSAGAGAAVKHWVWFGQAGHHVASDSCLFHLHTHVGRWCISTVGEYYPRSKSVKGAAVGEPVQIGSGRLYETMVFPLGADGEVTDWSGEAGCGYNDRAEANEGHVAMCRKYAVKRAKAGGR